MQMYSKLICKLVAVGEVVWRILFFWSRWLEQKKKIPDSWIELVHGTLAAIASPVPTYLYMDKIF